MREKEYFDFLFYCVNYGIWLYIGQIGHSLFAYQRLGQKLEIKEDINQSTFWILIIYSRQQSWPE
jgi:hypothetical protein